MDLQLKGRVAIVTGASQGIGRAIAETLAAEGMPVAIVSRLNGEIAKIMRSVDLKPVLDNVGADPIAMTPDQFGKHLVAEIAKLGAIVRAVGAHVD